MTLTQRTSGPSDGGHTATEQKHVLDYVRILYKRRWIALPVFLVLFAVGAVNTLRETAVYQGKVQLLIESDTPKVAKLDQMFESGASYYDDDFRQTQYRILQSRSLAKLTIDAMKLWDAPSLGAGPAARGSITVTGLVRTAVHFAITFARASFPDDAEAPAPPTAAQRAGNETGRQSGRIDEFLGGLTIAPVRASRIVEVKYSSTDPVFAAAAANAVVKAYIQQNMEAKFTTSKDAADFLGDRLAEQRKALEVSEAALQAYKERNGTVSVTDSASNIVVQRLTDLNAALTKAKTERINKEAQYAQLKSAEGSGGLDTYPAVLENEYVQKLKADLADLQRQQATLGQRYGDRNPEMIKIRGTIETAEVKLKNELSKVVESVKNQYQAALGEERSLQAALDSQKGEALSLNRKGIEYGVLLREVESNKQIYDSLMHRTKETGISSELRASNVRVVDPAEIPRSPISPNVQRGLMVAFGASLFLAVVLAFGLEYLDNRVKTPEQIRLDLGLPFLGMVPAIARKHLNAEPPLLSNSVPTDYSEALRSVRTSLLFSSAKQGAKSLVITSTGPGEGKTLMASNIAIALAQAGQRVVLIDADMRRPRVHELFRQDQEPGLSNLIVGTMDPNGVMQASGVPGLSLIPAGHIPPNPSELLGSRRFREVIDSFEDRFDWIIIDSPPVMAVTDACLLAHDATGVLFVVGSEMTNRHVAAVALDQLEAAQAKFVGAVLNRVDLKRHSHYYAQYYRKEYVNHYASPGGAAPRINKPQAVARNAQSAAHNPQSAIRNPQSAIRNPQSAIRNPQSAIRNP
jgi:succinoglycan biosynthesis transport protein ExoP